VAAGHGCALTVLVRRTLLRVQHPGPAPLGWVRALDAAVEGTVVAIASFTLLHLVALPLDWSVRPVTWVWLVLSVTTTGVLVLQALRRPTSAVERAAGPSTDRTTPPSRLLVVAMGLALAAAVLAGVLGSSRFFLLWAVVLGAMAVTWWWVARADRGPTAPSPVVPAGGREHGIALLLGGALAAFMWFVRNPSADDIYYVNRSTWVAERGTFPLRDTMFGPETHPVTYGGGLPVTAVEELLGAVARLLGVEAGTAVYLLALPFFVLLSAWVTWRLVEAWAVRSRLLVLAVALVLPLFVATGLVGDFGPARMWQGKVVALGVLVPLAWLHLTRLGDRSGDETPAGRADRRRSVLVLAVLGVAWCGLAVTAPLFAPPVALAALVTGLVCRRARGPMLLGAAALAAAPVLTGLVTLLVNPGGPVAEEVYIRTAGEAWTRVLGSDRVVVSLLVLGVLVGPLLVRSGASRVLAATASLALVVAAAPGMIALFDAVTSSGPVASRLLLTAPVHVLVAMLVTARVPLRVRASARAAFRHQGVVLAATIAAVLAAFGTPAWDSSVGGTLTDRPSWKVREDQLADVRQLLAEDPGPGPVLLPDLHMRVLAVTTTWTFAAVPRTFYVALLQEDLPTHSAREILRRFVDVDRPDPPVGRLRSALVRLGVTVACAPVTDPSDVASLARTGFVGRRTVGSMVCFDRPDGTSIPVPSWPGGRKNDDGSGL
jgi:hypothetical protein